MPSVDWFWFIVGLLVGKFALDFITMLVMNVFARITGKTAASITGM